MNITTIILDSIKSHLLAQISDVSIELFPDNPKDYYLANDFGAILIQYIGSDFEPTGSSDVMVQKRVLNLVLTVLARSQHDDCGALDLLDKARLALIGFKPEHCLACALKSEEFSGEFEGIWQYQLFIQTESWQVQRYENQGYAPLESVSIRQTHVADSDKNHPFSNQ